MFPAFVSTLFDLSILAFVFPLIAKYGKDLVLEMWALCITRTLAQTRGIVPNLRAESQSLLSPGTRQALGTRLTGGLGLLGRLAHVARLKDRAFLCAGN